MSQVTRPAEIAVEEWRLRALDKRRQGKDFRTIAAELATEGGPGSVSRAYELVIEGLQCREAAQDIRDVEIQRCDGMIEVLWARLNPATDGKKISARTAARLVDSILRVQDRKARFLGLDAPKRIEATGGNGAPLLPPGSVVVQFVRPGEPIPPPPPAPPSSADTGGKEEGSDGKAIDAVPPPRADEPPPPYK
jgi:hypothetical protein